MLNYGVIGGGMMGQEHIRFLQFLEGARVAAVADPDPEMRAAAAGLSAAPAFADYRDMLGGAALDVLVIATSNHTHEAVLADALATGLPILVEKPLCTTTEACRRILDRAAGRPAPVWVAMEYRFMPPVARLVAEVRAGTIGVPRMVAIREHRFPFLHKVGHWNRFAETSGGTMVEKCCHFFDLMRLILASEPTRLFASGGQDVNHLEERYDGRVPDILDNAFVTVEFANGARALLDLCMFAEASRDQEEIAVTGDRGKVECGVPSSTLIIGKRQRLSRMGESLKLHREVIPVEPGLLELGDHHGATYYQHRRFRDLILAGGGAPEVGLADGLAAVEMGMAAERSVREGLPVALPGGAGPARDVSAGCPGA